MSSALSIYSVCVVAEDKELGKNSIKCFPIEKLGEHDGSITEEKDKKKDEKKTMSSNEAGSMVQSTVTKEVTIEAQWVNIGGSNRVTAPDVKKGETVLVFKFGSSERYYWTTFFIEHDLRRNEAVVNTYGNEKEFGKILNEKNTYYSKFDTVNKMVHIHTSDNDGELTTYDFTLDTKKGIFTILDGKKNKIELNSKSGTLTIDIPNVTVNSKNVIVNSSNTTFKGGKVDFDSTVSFNASVKCNKNCTTEPKSGEPHDHEVL